MRIWIRIDRLTLDGLPIAAAQLPQVRAAIESELRRLVIAEGLPRELRSGGATPRLDAPAARVSRGHPTRTGRQIAGAVYRSLGTRR